MRVHSAVQEFSIVIATHFYSLLSVHYINVIFFLFNFLIRFDSM